MTELTIIFISFIVIDYLIYQGLIKEVEINNKIKVCKIKDDHDNSRIKTKI